MTGRIDKHGQLHLTFHKQDAMIEINPPTWLLTGQQTDELREVLGVRKPDNVQSTDNASLAKLEAVPFFLIKLGFIAGIFEGLIYKDAIMVVGCSVCFILTHILSNRRLH